MNFKNLVGTAVHNKKTKSVDEVVYADSSVVIVSHQGVEKAFTHPTFLKNYEPVSNVPEVPTPEPTQDIDEAVQDVFAIRNRFLSIVRVSTPEEDVVEIFNNPTKKMDTIKLNGKGIFKIYYTKNLYKVYCHPKSLTPETRAKATFECPRSWGWVLSCRYDFSSTSQSALMRSIIYDGIYYRSKRAKNII